MSKAIFGKNSISCVRGPLSKMSSVLKDRQENEWYSEFDKKDFEELKDIYHVQVYDKTGRKAKKFMKNYLMFVRNFEEEINKK